MARRARFALLSIALVCGVPLRARAWTEAQVTSVAARVELGADASVHARLDLKIGVHGGFLTELELAGLDPALELDPAVPVILTAVPGGETYTPTVEARRDGRVILRFRAREAPRRGQYAVSLAYTASLVDRGVTALESGDVRFSWTLPGWRSGLDAVHILVVAPRGARPETTTHWDDRTVTVTRRDLGERVEIDLERAHLPRTVPWVVNVVLPRASVAESLRRAVATHETPALAPTRARAFALSPFVVAAVAVLLALLKKAAFVRAATKRESRVRPLLPVESRLVHTALVLGAGAAAATFPIVSPLTGFAGSVALILLTIERTPSARPRGRLGGFRAMTKDDLRDARRHAWKSVFEPVSMLDFTKPLGFVLAASVLAALAMLHVREPLDPSDAAFTTWHALALLACQWLTASARLLPSSAEDRLRAIVTLATQFKMPAITETGLALRIVVHTDTQAQLTDARVRVVSQARAAGLVRLDIALADRPSLSGHALCPVWLVVTRAESAADALLDASLRGHAKTVAPGGRRARVLPFSAASLAALMPLLHDATGLASGGLAQETRRAS